MTLAVSILTAMAGLEPAVETNTPSNNTSALVFELDYTSDIWTNASGGNETGIRYLNNIDATLAVDLDALGVIPNTSVFVYGLYNNGEAFSGDLVGDAQVISNIEAPVEAVRLYEAWIEHELLNGSASLKVGLYDVNSEFDALETSSLFINSAHGIGTDIGQTGENGPSIFPITSLGVRGAFQVSEQWTIRAAILDATPGNPSALKRTSVSLDDGALLLGEIEHKRSKLKLIAGHWRYTNDFDTFDGDRSDGNTGYYLRGEAVLKGGHFDDKAALSVFARIGSASAEHNDFQAFYSIGVVQNDAFLPGDKLGLAVAIAETSSERRRIDPFADRRETAIELTYAVAITDHIHIQPDIQYIIAPGTDTANHPNALAFGFRSVFSLGLEH